MHQLAVVPEEGEVPSIAGTLPIKAADSLESANFTPVSPMLGMPYGLLHDDQRTLPQLQHPPGCQVENRVFLADAAAESRRVGVTERAVVVQAGFLPGLPCIGGPPAQKMLASPPGVLPHAGRLRSLPQQGKLPADVLRGQIGPVPRVQADLMSPRMNGSQQSRDFRILQRIRFVIPRIGLFRNKIKAAAHPGPLALLHQPAERVVRVRLPDPVAAARGPGQQPALLPGGLEVPAL
ncbi:hypothetical protein D1872_226690 [compost metagenome]